MKTPTLEEVKEYFKDAETVKSLHTYGASFKIDHSKEFFKESKNGIECRCVNNLRYDLWNINLGYAEILTTKTKQMKTYQIDHEFLMEAYNSACGTWKKKIKYKFPSAFENILENNKWYKFSLTNNLIFKVSDAEYYGFFGREWTTHKSNNINWYGSQLATDKEVEEDLSNECSKLGLTKGVKIVDIYNGKTKKDTIRISSNEFSYEEVPFGVLSGKMALRDSNGAILFIDGTFATIISEPIEITLEQIAEKFNVSVEQIKIKK